MAEHKEPRLDSATHSPIVVSSHHFLFDFHFSITDNYFTRQALFQLSYFATKEFHLKATEDHLKKSFRNTMQVDSEISVDRENRRVGNRDGLSLLDQLKESLHESRKLRADNKKNAGPL